MNRSTCLVSFLAAATVFAGTSLAQSVEQRLDKLEQENATLRNEVSSLKSTSQPASASVSSPVPIAPSQQTIPAPQQWKVGLRPNGGGFYLQSPDENFSLSFLGYVQATAEVTDLTRAFSFGNGDFYIQRARTDLIAEFYKTFTLAIEPDFATLGGTSLVEAKMNVRIVKDAVQLRVGKFVTPFSSDNYRSARALDTVQRYILYRSMLTLPALDTQTGIMLWGNVPVPGAVKDEARNFTPNFSYYAGVYNGNASPTNDAEGTGGNSRDSNNDKEFQAKLVYQPLKPISFGVGYDHNTAEKNETFHLLDYAGATYISVPAGGQRDGGSADFCYEPGKFSLRGEAMLMNFQDAHFRVWGGFLQAAYFIVGDNTKGIQPLIRFDYAKIEGDAVHTVEGDSITACTFGVNWFINGNVRVQVDYTPEYFNGAGNTGNVLSESVRNTFYTQLQMKF